MVVVGLDEVGRGSWAGPLVAGAVALHRPIKGLKDSKQLSKLRREFLSEEIQSKSLAFGLGWVHPKEIDQIGLTESVRLAMKRALEHISAEFDALIIDGAYNFFPEEPRARAIIKADSSEPAVSAASILAKVARDQYMTHSAVLYPHYGFAAHVGYGTSAHLSTLVQYGPCMLHRRSLKPVKTVIETLSAHV